MKRNLLGMCLVALLACAGTAWADILAQDSAANYGEDNLLVDGGNGGWGFGNWQFWNAAPTLADSTAGVCGNINSENGVSFRFARSADNEWCNGYRGFEALNAGDTLSFRFTCAYCGGNRGLDLFANGGHSDEDKIANVIRLSGDNEFSVNGTVISTEWAPNCVTTVDVSQEADGIKIAVARVPVDEGGAGNVAYWTKVETDKKLTGIGIYAGGWDWKDGADVENYAFYVNDLKIEGTPPADKLSLEGPWSVTSASAELPFKVVRTKSAGALAVTLASSYADFASVPESVTIPDGATEVSFTVNATLQGNANSATISATAEGVVGAEYGIKGPEYSCNVWDEGVEEPWKMEIGDTRTFWVNNGHAATDFPDNSLVTVESSDDGIVELASTLDAWNVGDDGKAFTSCYLSGVACGQATIKVLYDGVEMTQYDVTVLTSGATFDGPTSLRVGQNGTYVLDVVLTGGMTDAFGLVASPDGLVSISPSGKQTLEASGKIEFTVEALSAGDVTLSVEDDAGLATEMAPIALTISEAPDYSKYIAYDEASFYDGYGEEAFDDQAVGEGTDKFQAWEVVTENSGGIFISDSAPDASVLTENKAFGIWANGTENAELQLRRPFVNALGDGQAFSVVLSPNWRAGTKGVKFLGAWEGSWYERAEFFYNDYGYFYKLDGDADATSLDWDYGTDAITVTLKKAADGSGYTLSFARGDEIVAKEGITSFQGTVDGVQFYSYQGGEGGENNLIFNKLAIEQLETPVVKRNIGIIGTWNMDTTGDFDFYVGPADSSEDPIGKVALSVSPDDGRVVVSPASVDVPGDNVAAFTVSVISLPDEGEAATTYTITAEPESELVNTATFQLTPTRPYVYLYSETPDHTTAEGNIWIALRASPSRFGTYAITTDDEAVFSIPEEYQSRTVSEEQTEAWFNVSIVGPSGETGAAIYATLNDDVWCDYRFHVTEAPDPVEPVRITAISIKNGEMTLTLDPAGEKVFAATELENGDWKWQELDLAIIGDGTSVTVPMDGNFEVFRAE